MGSCAKGGYCCAYHLPAYDCVRRNYSSSREVDLYRLVQDEKNLLRVGCSRHFGEIDPEMLHTCFMSPFQPVYERVLFFFRQMFGRSGGEGYLSLKESL